jgi:hypothetical protein
MQRAGRKPEGKPYTAKVILGYFLSWKTVLFTLVFSALRLPLDSLSHGLTCAQRCNHLAPSHLQHLYFG